jgi:hypothetical protein
MFRSVLHYGTIPHGTGRSIEADASARVLFARAATQRTFAPGDSESIKNGFRGLVVFENRDAATISVNRRAHPNCGLISPGL